MRARHAVVASLLVALAAFVTACADDDPSDGDDRSTSAATPTPTVASPPAIASDRGGTLRWAVEDVSHVVPGDATSRDELLIVSALYEPLTRLDADGRPRAALAASWQRLDDGRRWRFVLDEESRFVDEEGEQRQVTADDVAFAWHRAAAEGAAGFLLRDVEGYEQVAEGESSRLRGVEALDDSTLDVTLTDAHGAFDVVVSHPSLAPLPRDRWQEDEDAVRERPVGNGPYGMAEAVVPDRYVRVQPVEGWRRGEPGVDEILFQMMSPDSAFVAFQQERLDVGPVPEDALDRAREEYGEASAGGLTGGLLTEPVPDLLALGVNVRHEPFDQPEVRRALSMAVDRTALAATVPSPAAAAPATSLLPPGLLAGGDGRCAHCRHDPGAASAVFAAHDVEELTLWIDEDGGHQSLEIRLRRDLAAAGVALEVKARAFDEWIDAVRGGDAAAFRLAWLPEHRTGLDVLEPLQHRDGLWNHTGLADDELDRLLDEARAATTRTRRQALLQQAEARALDLATVLPLGRGEHRTVISNRVEGLRLDPLGRTDLSQLRLTAQPEDDAAPE